MACMSGDATGCRPRRRRSATTISSAQRPSCAASAFPPWSSKESMMKAYLLDQPNRSIATDDLRKFGVMHWRLPLASSQAEIARIKRDRGYVDQDEVSLSKETPNL